MEKERRKVQMFTAEQLEVFAHAWLRKGMSLLRNLKHS
jgi:hypothetical protein